MVRRCNWRGLGGGTGSRSGWGGGGRQPKRKEGWRRRDGAPVAGGDSILEVGRKEVVRRGGRRWWRRGLDRRDGRLAEEEAPFWIGDATRFGAAEMTGRLLPATAEIRWGRQMGEAAARQLGWGGDSASDGVGAWATRVKTRGPGEVAAEGGGRREGAAGPR
jgi:hypothetical protein